MLFNSIEFAVFLPIIFGAYWMLPHRFRWVWLLAASYYFYMSWNAKYVFLILFTTGISYFAALALEKTDSPAVKKWILGGTAAACFSVLFFFKYFNFVSQSAAELLGIFSISLQPLTLKLLLPVGISFYTFQTLSYVIDVYRGTIAAERHFGIYATFISFFPQLVAGPIERTSNLLPQIRQRHEFCYEQATYGLKLMAWGFFKKMVIADTLSRYVSMVYENPVQFQGFALVLATVFFTIQIYCDFSGYSDIAIGTAKLLGIELMTNFKSPYFSQSIKEFWSRWHISLSTWFRDYLYIPLGGSRVSRWRHSLNLVITFLVSGLWHGANWTFVVWGGIHGLAQAAENVLLPKNLRKSQGIPAAVRMILIFAFCAFTWIFFVSNSISDACYVISHLFVGISHPAAYIRAGFAAIPMGAFKSVQIAASILLLAVYDWYSLKGDCIQWISSRHPVIRYAFYLGIMLVVAIFHATVQAQFVYFQF